MLDYSYEARRSLYGKLVHVSGKNSIEEHSFFKEKAVTRVILLTFVTALKQDHRAFKLQSSGTCEGSVTKLS